MAVDSVHTPYPFSPNERIAMSRYVSTLRNQLQELSELFSSRYGKHSSLTDLSTKALVCATLLEQELLAAEPQAETSDLASGESVMIKTASHG